MVKAKDQKEPKTLKLEPPASKTIRRRTSKSYLSDDDMFSIVRDYMETDLSNSEIAKRYKTSQKNVEMIVTRHWKSLTNVRETKNLLATTYDPNNHKGGNYLALKAIGNVPSINQDFLMLLSEPEDNLLTDPELHYCYEYVLTGDNSQAIINSGLNVGIMGSPKDKKRHEYLLACRLRGHFLRQKKNVAQYIMKLKEEQFSPEIIDKHFVQRELLEQLAQLKESNDSPTVRAQILKTIQDLGRTIGAFSDVLKVQELDPGAALDYLESLEEAKAIDHDDSQDIILQLEE